jgi:hypothetical protein
MEDSSLLWNGRSMATHGGLMKKIPICVAILLLFCLAMVEAENDKRTTSSNSDSSEVTTQTATTSDGRKVILKSDGTWEYYKETPPSVSVPKQTPPSVALPKEAPLSVTVPKESSPKVAVPKEAPPSVTVPKEILPKVADPNESEKGTLSFDARVGSKSGDAKPITGGSFYLLDNDLNNILQTSGLKPEKRLSLLNTFLMANYGSLLGIERSAKAFASAMESVKPHIVATTTSDVNGKGQFTSLVPGTYYLMNVGVIYLNTGSLTDRKAVLWNVKVHIKPGQNSTTLDEKNAVP